MRILQVIHQYPPFSSQGSEVHCQQLGQALDAAGDTVAVFHISKTSASRPLRLEHGMAGRIELFHCIDNGQYNRIAAWPNAFLRDSFRQALAEFRPEVVHFHNYLSLGDNLIGMAHATGAAVVYTLHDYGLICPNNLLLKKDGGLCDKYSPDFFQDCCPEMIRVSGGAKPVLRSRLPPLFRWRSFATNQPGTVARTVLQGLVALGEAALGDPMTTAVEEKKHFYLAATQQIFELVHLFIAPSIYLRERYLDCSLDPRRVVHERYGLPGFPRPAHRPSPDGRIRFGYIGAFHAHKGIHVLLEAFKGLAGRASLHLYGSSFGSPVSEAHFRRITADPAGGFVVHGRYDNARLGEILGGLDAVVVPSVWFENSPLTIQEAQLAGVPVITANAGGMAELVRDGVDGLLFRLGDAADLRRVMQMVLERPGLLADLRRQAPAVPTIEAQTARIRGHYVSALDRARCIPAATTTFSGTSM